jgi:hypothetical protein
MTGKAPNRPGDQTDKLVEKLLRQLPYADPSLKGDPETPLPAAPRPSGLSRRPSPPGWQRSWGWVALALALGAGLSQWPYARSCGFPLYGYLSVVALLPVIALRAAIVSWSDRRAFAHVLAVLMIFSGAYYAAEVVLPRVNYAQETASWQCSSAAIDGSGASTSESPVVQPGDSLGSQETLAPPVSDWPTTPDTIPR